MRAEGLREEEEEEAKKKKRKKRKKKITKCPLGLSAALVVQPKESLAAETAFLPAWLFLPKPKNESNVSRSLTLLLSSLWKLFSFHHPLLAECISAPS